MIIMAAPLEDILDWQEVGFEFPGKAQINKLYRVLIGEKGL